MGNNKGTSGDVTRTAQKYIETYIDFMHVEKEIYFQFADIPGVLNAVYGFKWHWKKHFVARKLIEFQRLDNNRNFDKMRDMLAPQGCDDDGDYTSLGDFLRYHVKMTAPVWTWNFNFK